MDDQKPAHRFERPGRTRARGLALLSSAITAGVLLAACSVDRALDTSDLAPVGSITPAAERQAAPRGTRFRQAAIPGAADTQVDSAAVVRSDLAPATTGTDAQGTFSGPDGKPPLADTRHLAEGVVDQPVVGGLGNDSPVELTQAAGSGAVLPQPAAATELYEGPRMLGAPPAPLHLPEGAAAGPANAGRNGRARPVEVAGMPRVADPAGLSPDGSDAASEGDDDGAGALAPASPEAVAPLAAAPRADQPRMASPQPPTQAPQSRWGRNPADAPGALPAAEAACRQDLDRLGVTYTELPPIHQGAACGIDHPIRLIALSGGIRIQPAATLDCRVTAEFARWVKTDLAPAARSHYLSGIRSITQLSAYSCRTMNSQRGAPMSEHAHGNAIDVGAVTLNSGRRIDVRKPGWFAFRQRGFLDTVRAESCDHFTTVIGPGTNKYHWNHFHFDLRQRRSGKSYCE